MTIERHDRIKPKFGFPIRAGNMNMNTRFFARKEKEAIILVSKDSGAHKTNYTTYVKNRPWVRGGVKCYSEAIVIK